LEHDPYKGIPGAPWPSSNWKQQRDGEELAGEGVHLSLTVMLFISVTQFTFCMTEVYATRKIETVHFYGTV